MASSRRASSWRRGAPRASTRVGNGPAKGAGGGGRRRDGAGRGRGSAAVLPRPLGGGERRRRREEHRQRRQGDGRHGGLAGEAAARGRPPAALPPPVEKALKSLHGASCHSPPPRPLIRNHGYPRASNERPRSSSDGKPPSTPPPKPNRPLEAGQAKMRIAAAATRSLTNSPSFV